MTGYRFYKEGANWYIDLPAYLEQGGSLGDLQMVEGADTMLDKMAEGRSEVLLSISSEPFEGANELEIIEKCDPHIGGAYYILKNFEGQTFNQHMWLCGVIEFVFGGLPERIYVKRENGYTA
ncbi:MAG: DUF6717 family protein [Flavisolibacter sp.]